jgi:hypothetical protein
MPPLAHVRTTAVLVVVVVVVVLVVVGEVVEVPAGQPHKH